MLSEALFIFLLFIHSLHTGGCSLLWEGSSYQRLPDTGTARWPTPRPVTHLGSPVRGPEDTEN